MAMRRAPRGLEKPDGTVRQEADSVKVLSEFLGSADLSSDGVDKIHTSLLAASSLPTQNFCSLLTAFSIFLQTKKNNKSRAADGYLAKGTALRCVSQIVSLLRERYNDSQSVSQKSVTK
ncbi:unnamed protein product [Phytophthora lilii]|uniref:Unnamed protein product n=1 Tax=Phytophthora lilii TaxID=2077276 RepID=A0A9W6X2T8_9STRA|nr:unnamed protein product [Phytophthora lilii]